MLSFIVDGARTFIARRNKRREYYDLVHENLKRSDNGDCFSLAC